MAPQTSDADSYFELNKRQADLDQLRHKAGANPDPLVKADRDDFQHRIDANRTRLDAKYKIADQQVNELLRAGFAPFDVASGASNIVSGSGEVRDYLAVAGAIPLGATVGKIGKTITEPVRAAVGEVVQLGGPYRIVRRLRGYHAHHLVADKVSPLGKGDGPSIAMLPEHHTDTASYGSKASAKSFRKQQEARIELNDFEGALQLGIDEVRKNNGNLYDGAIEQAVAAYRKKGADR